MISGHCFKDGCKNTLYGKCECKENILFCFDHSYEHLETLSEEEHRPMKLYFTPNDEIKEPVIAKLNEIIRDIKELKKNVLQSASEAIRNFQASFGNYIEKVIQIEKNCKKLIDLLNRGDKFLDIAGKNSMESVLKLDVNQANKRMSSWNVKCYEVDLSELMESVKNAFDVNFDPFLILIEEHFESSELSFFRHNTTNFATVNLDDFQVSTVAVNAPETINAYTGVFSLEKNSYFYYGNNNYNSGLTFIIDKNKNVKQLSKAKQNVCVQPICVGNYIYIFGGSSGLAERYDIAKNIWESLAPLPSGLDLSNSCTTQFGDIILITGYSIQKIISYNIPQNKYGDVPKIALQESLYKSLLRGNSRIYLFEHTANIFESAVNNIRKWASIGTNSLTGNHFQSGFIQFKGSIWFIEYSNVLWRFDLSSKQVIKVGSV